MPKQFWELFEKYFDKQRLNIDQQIWAAMFVKSKLLCCKEYNRRHVLHIIKEANFAGKIKGYKFDKTEYFKVEIGTKNQLSLTVIFYSINALFIIMHFTVLE